MLVTPLYSDFIKLVFESEFLGTTVFLLLDLNVYTVEITSLHKWSLSNSS